MAREPVHRGRDIGVVQALYARYFFTGLVLLSSLATALVYGVGGLVAPFVGIKLIDLLVQFIPGIS